MTIAIATYRNCCWGDAVQTQAIELPSDRTTPAAVASYLRFGDRITAIVACSSAVLPGGGMQISRAFLLPCPGTLARLIKTTVGFQKSKT
jgi:hypothetical protein